MLSSLQDTPGEFQPIRREVQRACVRSFVRWVRCEAT